MSLSRTRTLLSSFSRVLISPREPGSASLCGGPGFHKTTRYNPLSPQIILSLISLLANGILFLTAIKCRHCSLSTPLLTVFSPL